MERQADALVCEACKERIEETEARVVCHDPAGENLSWALHHCCMIDHFLFEVFGALVLGVKYECVCLHARHSDDFEVTFLSRQLSKATTKLIVRNRKGGEAMKK